MRYISVCSGIEAATVAWHDLGWTPVAFSEIEPFPSAVLQHHYPHVPNLGDMTKFKEWNLEPVDLLVGGTPCQSFSVAGLRKGLHDPRGGLMLTFLEIAQRYRPRWVVWENVPGVLSSNGGRDFGTFLGALGELGYGWAYRVLDAQWFGVAQRRRRVFVVGHLGDWQRAAQVLFERESVQRNPAPSREAREAVAGTIAARFGISRNNHEELAWSECVGGGPDGGRIAGAVTRKWAKGSGGPAGDECYNMVAQPVAGSHWDSPANPHPTLNQSAKGSGGIAASDQELFSQRGSGLVAQPVAFKVRGGVEVDSAGKAAGKGYLGSEETAFTLAATQDQWVGTPPAMQVRRLTPVECSRLQGFPDNYTNIPWRGKPESPDGPRYKALGNSMAVPCMRWIGERINAIEEKLT